MKLTVQRNLIQEAMTGLREFYDPRLFAGRNNRELLETALALYPEGADPRVIGWQPAYDQVRDGVEKILKVWSCGLPDPPRVPGGEATGGGSHQPPGMSMSELKRVKCPHCHWYADERELPTHIACDHTVYARPVPQTEAGTRHTVGSNQPPRVLCENCHAPLFYLGEQFIGTPRCRPCGGPARRLAGARLRGEQNLCQTCDTPIGVLYGLCARCANLEVYQLRLKLAEEFLTTDEIESARSALHRVELFYHAPCTCGIAVEVEAPP